MLAKAWLESGEIAAGGTGFVSLETPAMEETGAWQNISVDAISKGVTVRIQDATRVSSRRVKRCAPNPSGRQADFL
jgi:hypothetical protein